jgi:hypothetical protein
MVPMIAIQTSAVRSESYDFTYLLEKVSSAEFCQEPFRHIEIYNFLAEEHFHAVTTSKQVRISRVDSSEDLINTLFDKGYEAIAFPGCTTSVYDYLNWLRGNSNYENIETCGGFGITFRLNDPQDNILAELGKFLKSTDFKMLLEDKFGLTRPTTIDGGLQKYLHGYEISPHPDIRKKALTYMLNINPSDNSENLDIHTHYLTFKPHKRFIGEFWRYNEEYDRCWLPWEWCDTVKRQQRNNSIVIFAPSWNTLHAVKLNYDHLQTQRTQFYGNLWYEEISFSPIMPQYYQFELQSHPEPRVRTRKSILKSYAKKVLPSYVRKLLSPIGRLW